METKDKKVKKTTSPKVSKKAEDKDVSKKEKTHHLILGTRVTEKSALKAEKGVYTFNVVSNANKDEIKKAINFLYGVKPAKISITKIADKKILRRGIASIKRGGKKAVVYLKKGDKITFA